MISEMMGSAGWEKKKMGLGGKERIEQGEEGNREGQSV